MDGKKGDINLCTAEHGIPIPPPPPLLQRVTAHRYPFSWLSEDKPGLRIRIRFIWIRMQPRIRNRIRIRFRIQPLPLPVFTSGFFLPFLVGAGVGAAFKFRLQLPSRIGSPSGSGFNILCQPIESRHKQVHWKIVLKVFSHLIFFIFLF